LFPNIKEVNKAMHKGRKALLLATQTLGFGVFLSAAFAADSANYTYLALGDSITFGLDPRLLPTPPAKNIPKPTKFVGYPEVIASYDSRFSKEVNASCPGETSASFLHGPPDNGCNSMGPTGQGPFRPTIDLHTNYQGWQYDFAISQLDQNKNIKLVTLNIGANDALLVVGNCIIAGGNVPLCISTNMPSAIAAYGNNLAAILAGIRSKYTGTLVVLNAYSPSPDLNGIAFALNEATAQVSPLFGAKVADAFGAFELMSAFKGGDVCAAGLLIQLKDGSCDQHPSEAGQTALAAAIEVAMRH